ncbi:hypothetical protein FRC08_009357 [Ceratobasidium sp. 394]|nr:hypothetical protein FRC08_009357 [Ceratobasidium sp. 394]KAG9089965.1 hypothetical protein FS749_000919 [Ceratobasidium sp. UAMH 11750]
MQMYANGVGEGESVMAHSTDLGVEHRRAAYALRPKSDRGRAEDGERADAKRGHVVCVWMDGFDENGASERYTAGIGGGAGGTGASQVRRRDGRSNLRALSEWEG